MSQDHPILTLIDEYFARAAKDEINNDVEYINSIGKEGVSFEQYLQNLDSITAFPIAEIGVCDDIAYSDYYNNLIAVVSMDDFSKFRIVTSIIIDNTQPAFSTSENTYSIAA